MDILKCTIIAVIISAVVGLGSYKNVGSCKMANMMPTTEQTAMKHNVQVIAPLSLGPIGAILQSLPKVLKFFYGDEDKD